VFGIDGVRHFRKYSNGDKATDAIMRSTMRTGSPGECTMATLSELRHSAISDFDAFVSRLRGLKPSQWDAPTPNKGWLVRHLAAHLVGTTSYLNGELLKVVDPVSESARLQGDAVTDDAPFEDITAALTINRNALAATLAEMTDAHWDKETGEPPQMMPPTGGLYLNLVASEVGIHLYDLLAAVDHGSAGLGEAAIDASDAIFGTAMVSIANGNDTKPEDPIAYHLDGRRVNRWIGFTGSEWTTVPDATIPVTTIHADDTALVLFAVGRIPDTDPRLSITGDASAFKTYIPGP
jgi:uncharacterized protein (TIGR03083 family)